MSHWAQGSYDVINRAKYVGKGTPRYRSGWELSFMRFCDTNDHILQWASESIAIPYKHPLTGKMTQYIPDFLITYRSKMSSRDRAVVAINYAKWHSATLWAKRNGMTFRVITEDDMFANGRA